MSTEIGRIEPGSELEKLLTDAGYIVIDKAEVLKIFPPPTDSITDAVKDAPKHWS